MSANGIAQLETREARQIAKLDLAQNKRQGNVLTVYNGLTSISTSGSGPGEFRNRPADWSFMQNVQIGWTINGPNIINGPVPITNIVYSAPQERAFIFHTGGTQNDEWSTVGQTGYIFSGYLSDPTTPAYRTRATYDITQLPTQYDGNNIVDNANTGGLLQGRPWNPDTIITVIEEGLVLNLDARNLNSWSREPGETVWNDLSGNNNHATVYGGISYGEALGGALAFGGTDAEYAQCPPGVYFTSAGYTIQSWVYIISVPNWNRIIDFGSDAGSDNVLLSATGGTSGEPVLWVGPSGDNVQSEVQLLPNTGWHQVCATWTPTGTVGKVFIDGVLTATGSMSAPTGGARANCYIGRSNWGNPPDPNFNGGMGAIQIYSRALSDAEILSNFNTTKSYYGL